MNLGHEDEQREFKKSTSELKEGVASIASILNKHSSGELCFGVLKDGEVCGQDVSESTLREISQAIGNHIEPSIYPSVTHESTPDGKDYVKVAFEGDAAPYSCGGKYRIRVADEDVLMRPDEPRNQFREVENRISPWDGRVSGKTIADVDEETLRKFVERGREKGRISFDFSTTQDALERLGLMKNGMLLNAGAAIFCPSDITDLKMGVFTNHSRTDIVGLRHESGALFDLVRYAEMFVISNTRSRVDTSVPGASDVLSRDTSKSPSRGADECLCPSRLGARECRDSRDIQRCCRDHQPGLVRRGAGPRRVSFGQERIPQVEESADRADALHVGRHRVAGNRNQAHKGLLR